MRPHATPPAERTGPKVGEEAPEVRLADLGGKQVSLQDFKGKETLVLFWSPGALSGAPASHSLRSGSICWQKPHPGFVPQQGSPLEATLGYRGGAMRG